MVNVSANGCIFAHPADTALTSALMYIQLINKNTVNIICVWPPDKYKCLFLFLPKVELAGPA